MENKIKTIVELDTTQAQASIIKLNSTASDSTKTLEERIAAKNEQIDLQNSLSEKTISNLSKEVKALEGVSGKEKEYEKAVNNLNKATLSSVKIGSDNLKSLNKLTDANAKQGDGIKSLRLQLREATLSQGEMAQKYGETSSQAIEAAKAVAELKDQIQFNKDLVDSFNPDQKFKALGAASQVAATGTSAVVSGMALFGDQSEETEKALLKVQAAMAFSDAISNLSNIGDQFKVLKSTVVNTWRALTTAKAVDTASTGANTAAVVTNTAAVAAETTVVSGSTIATTAATIATNLFNASLAILLAPVTLVVASIAALVLGIGYLAGAFGDFSGNTEQAIKDTKALGKSLDDESIALYKAGVAVRDKNKQTLAMAEANGKSTASVRALELKLIDEQIATDKASASTASNTFIRERNALAILKSTDASSEAIKAREKEVQAAYDTFKRENKQLDESYKEKRKLIKSQEVDIAKEKYDASVEAKKKQDELDKENAKKAEENRKRRLANELAALTDEINLKRANDKSSLDLELKYLNDKKSIDRQAAGLNNAELLSIEKKHQISVLEIKKTYAEKERQDALKKSNDQIILNQIDIDLRKSHGENTLALELELLEKKKIQELTYTAKTEEERNAILAKFKLDKEKLEEEEKLKKLEVTVQEDAFEIERIRARNGNTYLEEKKFRDDSLALELADISKSEEEKLRIKKRAALVEDTLRQKLIDDDLSAAAEIFGVQKELAVAKMIMAAPEAIASVWKVAATKLTIPGMIAHGVVGTATTVVPIIKGLADIKKARFPGSKKGGRGESGGGSSIQTSTASTGVSTSAVSDLAANNTARLGVDPSLGSNAVANASNKIAGGSSSGVVFSESKYNDFKKQVAFKESKTTI